ncbi:hypothetical protein VTN49DRAFT_4316 [Thermomyces lanuginosus]|uniref:uncharacterized protein n=1 Tax=Thermomyces lanuginosus TaxID=5541 RepID=UPI003743EF9C
MSYQTQYHEDSDADDEYERSVAASPQLPTDSEASPTDTDSLSTEHTPTTYGHDRDEYVMPRTVITEWTAEECADFVASLGLRQYRSLFTENEIVGEALIALKHEELKEMGITSVGHRLTILKSVYETKVKQDVPIDPDHYVPLSAEHPPSEPATQEDISRILQSIRSRDERLAAVEAELRRVTEDYRRLREELLPIFKMAKDRSQPLPFQPTQQDHHGHDGPNSGGLARSHSRRLYNGGTTPKNNNSPTHVPPGVHDGRPYNDGANLDPSAAAVAASSHLTASMNGSHSPGIPSPTSPAHFNQQMLNSRSYNRDGKSSRHDHDEQASSGSGHSSRPDGRGQGDSNGPSVEIFKSFRVSMDDPCQKVLPAALKKYNINADWRQYALYIVYGDQERCLALDERPLILFKQLEKEGRKPMFMLRKHAQPIDTSSSTSSTATPSVSSSSTVVPSSVPPSSSSTNAMPSSAPNSASSSSPATATTISSSASLHTNDGKPLGQATLPGGVL